MTVDLNNGDSRMSLRLDDPSTALLVKAGVWLRLRDFLSDCLIAVMAPLPHAETGRFDTPQPHLLPPGDHT